VLGEHAFVLRFIDGIDAADGSQNADRLLVINLGRQLTLSVMPEPLLSPYPRTAWRTIWTSEDPRYGGAGVADTIFKPAWTLPAECAIVLAPDPES
jgi:maltooligosyltrehalose trehalohydrolase